VRIVAIVVAFLIGTILLSAIIAAIVFGMSGSVERTKTVAATAKQSGNDIFVTWQGSRDNSLVSSYTVSLNDSEPGEGFPPLVGNTTRTGPGTPGEDHVVVMATFTDGSDQVILDTYV
jgi:hypothetical protein